MNKKYSDVIDIDTFISYIPVGRDNAARLRQIAGWSHMPERTAREMIARVNSSGKAMIINLSDGKGYFRANEQEKDKEFAYREQEVKRFISLRDKIAGINSYLGVKRQDKKKSALEEMQIDLFQYLNGGDYGK